MSNTSATSSFPFFTILGLIFITLKLLGYLDWSWWLVLLPIWGPMAIGLSVFIGILIFAVINDSKKEK
jgi:hypothetical protein